jgi:hypothetical protein
VFYTDNVGKDGNHFKDLFMKIYDVRNQAGQERLDPQGVDGAVKVFQDNWHARERIIKLLPSSHPQHKEASIKLRQVFSRLVSKVR